MHSRILYFWNSFFDQSIYSFSLYSMDLYLLISLFVHICYVYISKVQFTDCNTWHVIIVPECVMKCYLLGF